MSGQSTVHTTMPIGVAGQLADEHTAQFGDVVSGTNQEASAEIPFGVMVKAGTTDQTVKLCTSQADVLKGVVVFGHQFDYPTERGETGLKPGATFGVLRKGRILVTVEAGVTPADEVHVRISANGGHTQTGTFGPAADGAHTVDLTGLASWQTSADTGELAVLNIDMDGAGNAVNDA